MTKIQIIKKQDGYAYKYYLMDKNNKPFYVTKSGFKTPEKALEVAKKSYEHRIKNSQPIDTKKTKPNKKQEEPTKVEKIETTKPVEKTTTETTVLKQIPVETKTIRKKEEPSKVSQDTTIVKVKRTAPPIKINIKNLDITANGYKIIETAVFGTIAIVIVCGAVKIYNDMKDILPQLHNTTIEEDENNINKELITVDSCDFSNLYIVLRTAEKETTGVSAVTSDMLTKLGVSNEVIYKDSDIASNISRVISNNPDSNIVVINLESGLENQNSNNTIIMGDCSNKRIYSSDLLAASINAALNDYNLNSTVKSGQKADIWRKQTYLEEDLSKDGLINKVSQLTIDLPKVVGEDELTRNDAAASIVEGLMRWTTIDKKDRYKDVYYTTQYSDTIIRLMQDHDISMKYIEENSDIDMNKGAKVGNTLLLEPLPKIITNTTVLNPYTTTDKSQVKLETATYVVQYGDTVTKIANTYGMEIEDVSVPSGDIDDIRPGDIVYVNKHNLYETHSKENIEENAEEKSNIK